MPTSRPSATSRFLVLFVALWKLAWGPILKGLQSREERINASLQRAEELEKAKNKKAFLAEAKARGEADKYVDEVVDVVRRTLGRPVRGSARG